MFKMTTVGQRCRKLEKDLENLKNRVDQLTCGHISISYGEVFDLPFKKCDDCGKFLAWFSSTEDMARDKVERHEKEFKRLSAQLKKMTEQTADPDALVLATRLYSEDPATFSPDTAEVMDRYRPVVEAILKGEKW